MLKIAQSELAFWKLKQSNGEKTDTLPAEQFADLPDNIFNLDNDGIKQALIKTLSSKHDNDNGMNKYQRLDAISKSIFYTKLNEKESGTDSKSNDDKKSDSTNNQTTDTTGESVLMSKYANAVRRILLEETENESSNNFSDEDKERLNVVQEKWANKMTENIKIIKDKNQEAKDNVRDRTIMPQFEPDAGGTTVDKAIPGNETLIAINADAAEAVKKNANGKIINEWWPFGSKRPENADKKYHVNLLHKTNDKELSENEIHTIWKNYDKKTKVFLKRGFNRKVEEVTKSNEDYLWRNEISKHLDFLWVRYSDNRKGWEFIIYPEDKRKYNEKLNREYEREAQAKREAEEREAKERQAKIDRDNREEDLRRYYANAGRYEKYGYDADVYGIGDY